VRNFGVVVDSMHFSFERTAAPKWADQGTCSADLKASDIYLEWAIHATGPNPPRFKLDRVVVDISKFDVEVKEAGHKFIDQMIIGLFSEDLRLNAQKAVEDSLRHHSAFLTKSFDDFFVDQMFYLSPPPFSAPDSDSGDDTSDSERSRPTRQDSSRESTHQPSSQEGSSGVPFALKDYSAQGSDQDAQHGSAPQLSSMLPETRPQHVDWDLYKKKEPTSDPGLPEGPHWESSHSGMPVQAKRHLQACELEKLPDTFSA